MTVTLTSRQAELYRYLCETLALVEGERVPTVTELVTDTGIPFATVTTGLAALAECGILSRELTDHCSVWLYEMRVTCASYEVTRARSLREVQRCEPMGIAINQEPWIPECFR